MITAAQLRAARGLLDWTRSDLAKAANISPETIKNIEHGTFRPQETTADAIVRAFGAQGVEFIADEGVCRNHNKIVTYKGEEGFKAFLDDIYIAAQNSEAGIGGSKPICISNVDDRLFIKHFFVGQIKEYSLKHAQRMNDLAHKVTLKILVKDKTHLNIPGTTYREYRFQEGSTEGNVPFYVYGDKLGILIFDEREPQIVVLSSSLVAKAYREQFNILWESAKALTTQKDNAQQIAG